MRSRKRPLHLARVIEGPIGARFHADARRIRRSAVDAGAQHTSHLRLTAGVGFEIGAPGTGTRTRHA